MILKVQILTDKETWFFTYSKILKNSIKGSTLIFSEKDIKEGDVLFILSWGKIIPMATLAKNKHNIVIHASDLPNGKGFAPLTWQIIEGKNIIPFTLFEAVEKVDAGKFYIKEQMELKGDEISEEIQKKEGEIIVKMALKFIDSYKTIKGKTQAGKESFYRKRNPKDSELDINKSIKEQFNLLRVVDNNRYPAFFKHLGKKYILKIYKDERN